MPLNNLLPLIPESLINQQAGNKSDRSVRLPLKQILQQLAGGRILVPLSEVVSQLPPELRASKAPYAGTDKILLPLDQVVANLSPELLQPRGDQIVADVADEDIPDPFAEDTTTPQWTNEPAPALVETPAALSAKTLFTESRSQSSTPTAEVVRTAAVAPQVDRKETPFSLKDTQPILPLGSDQTPIFVERVKQPTLTAAKAQDSNWRGQLIHISLKDIMDGVPDHLLAGSRETLAGKTDLNGKIPVGLDEIVDQLGKGRISLDLGKLVDKLPQGLLSSKPGDCKISIGVDAIYDQLPASVFTRGQDQQAAYEGIDTIPTPFREADTTEESAQTTEAASQTETQTQSVDAPELKPAPQPLTQETASESEKPATEPRAKSDEVTSGEPAASAEARIEDADQDLADLDTIAATGSSQEVSVAPSFTGKPASKEEIARALNNLNTWTEQELYQNNLGPTLTQRILEFRAQRGAFKDVLELLQIAGIGPKLFQRVLGFSPEAVEDPARAINRLLGVPEDHEMTLPQIVKCSGELPGVEGCIVAMSDGLFMTGELPKHFDTQRVSAFAPQLFSRVAQYVRELNAGTVRRFTVFTDSQPITIFKSGDLFFIVIHKANRFSKVLLNKCERISYEISRICSKENAKG